MKNPAVPFEQRDGESAEFKEAFLVLSSLSNPVTSGTANSGVKIFILDKINRFFSFSVFVEPGDEDNKGIYRII